MSRRAALLASGGALLLGGGAGAAYGALRPLTGREPPIQTPPPPDLVAALESESALIEGIDASVAGMPALRGVLAGVRADHVAHQAVLRAAVAAFPGRPASAIATASPFATVRAYDRAQLRAREVRAAAAVARYARGLHGRDAALLASISACEASHAELLA